MCNLNFNQCFGGSGYPIPIDTCRAQLVSLLNSNTTTIINPPVQASFMYANFLSPQNVWPGSLLGFRKQAGGGLAIKDNVDGSFLLGRGTYKVDFVAAGKSTAQNPLSLALVLDGVVFAPSQTFASGQGDDVSVENHFVVVVENEGSLCRIENIGKGDAALLRASLTLTKLQ